MERRIRGSGLRFTLPYVLNFAGLWLIVTIAAILVAAVSSYLTFVNRPGASGLRAALIIQTVLSILAVVALAVFTTHRVAGPWVAVKRALEAIRDGNFDYRLRMRGRDPRLQDVEIAFEQMVTSLRERIPREIGPAAPNRAPTVEAAPRA